MDIKGLNGEWHVPYELYKNMKQNFIQTNLAVILTTVEAGDVTIEARDGAVHTLKFLKYWCRTTPRVFFYSTNLLDRFLTKMKVQKRFLPCLIVSCFTIAAEKYDFNINIKKLIHITQSKCTVKDVERMCGIIKNKLDFMNEINIRTTEELLLHVLTFIYSVVNPHSRVFCLALQVERLIPLLEVAMCDGRCASDKPELLIMALILTEFERFLVKEFCEMADYPAFEMLELLTAILQMGLVFEVEPASFSSCHRHLSRVFDVYNNDSKSYPYKIQQSGIFLRHVYTPKQVWKKFRNLYVILE